MSGEGEANPQTGEMAGQSASLQSSISNLQSGTPFRVTLLAGMVLILTVWQALRLFETVRQWAFLQTISPEPPLGYLAISALIWALIGAALTWGLAYNKPWARRAAALAALLYALWYWFDRLVIANPAAIASRWPFALGLTLVLLAFAVWAARGGR